MSRHDAHGMLPAGEAAHTTGSSIMQAREADARRELEQGMARFISQGEPVLTGGVAGGVAGTGYHSVAGQPAQALLGTAADTGKPMTLIDFIDDRIRGIDAERLRLWMLRDQLVSSGCNPEVDVIRRVLG